MTPVEAVERIMTDMWPNNKLKFDRSERIDAKHVGRFWSTLKSAREKAAAKRDGNRQVDSVTTDADNDLTDLTIDSQAIGDDHVIHVSYCLHS